MPTAKKTTTATKKASPAPKKAVVPAQPAAATKSTPVAARAKALAPREGLWQLHLKKIAQIFEERGFETSLVNTLEEATALVMSDLLPASKAKSVSFGGSVTVTEANLIERIKQTGKYTVLNTADFSIGAEAMIELRRQSLLVDFFITSVNAITEEGQIVMLDGTGNRCAALQFGPKKVVLLIGRNKLCPDFETAIERIKNIAAPANAMRLNKKTPCVKTGYCMDCASPDRICSTWAITERSSPKGRIHLVLINEELGY